MSHFILSNSPVILCLIFGYISNFRDYFMFDTQMIIKTPLIEVSLLINTNVTYRCLKVCKLILLNLVPEKLTIGLV